MLTSSLCDYADVYILVKGIIAITGAGADDAAKQLDKRKIKEWYLKIVHHSQTV